MAQTPPTLEASQLSGTWHIVATTFPMWLDGSRKNPTFNYSDVRKADGRVVMEDRVAYDGGEILGVDVQHSSVSTHFTWSGRGFLAAFTSEWDVVSIDAKGRYAIITFSATMATPAGLDVISRDATLSDEDWRAALGEIEGTAELKAIAGGLTRL